MNNFLIVEMKEKKITEQSLIYSDAICSQVVVSHKVILWTHVTKWLQITNKTSNQKNSFLFSYEITRLYTKYIEYINKHD